MPHPVKAPVADVCLIVEGAYPYVQGGVSSWTQDLIKTQCHLRFHLLVIVAPEAERTLRYPLPPNVCGLTHVLAAQMPAGVRHLRDAHKLLPAVHAAAAQVMRQGDAAALQALLTLLEPYRGRIGSRLLLDSKAAWEAFTAVYTSSCDGASYLNAFWGWRTLVSGLFSAVLSDLPRAHVYHCISTGYAGLLAARAALATGRPAFVTEHGVYTNERRLEILSAPWLAVDDSHSLSIEGNRNKIKELWINTFVSYSKVCYRACSHVITLFEGNHPLQIEDGARPEQLSVIPNGIDLARYQDIVRIPHRNEGGSRRPAIALIGRVVPIKDVKTYLRACAILVRKVPDVLCYVLGPMDEDPDYAAACLALTQQLGLAEHVAFSGMANLIDYFGRLDVIVLTSISEAQPLVILEGGAAGVPSVATDVGACRELILGRADEVPNLGAGGRVTRIGHPADIAHALTELLRDEPLRQRCGQVMRARVRAAYDKVDLHLRYATLYDELMARPGQLGSR